MIRQIAQSYTTAVLAERIVDGRPVVIKLQRLKDMNFSALLMERFAQELNILSELNHPNVIKVLDHGVTEACIYYAMEHLSLGDLSQRLKREKATPEEAVSFTLQISSGVMALHEKNIVHRDIKPSNMLFKTEDSLVIADLGIAKDLSLQVGLTEQGEVLGTPYYMSPEQFGDAPVDKRSDIYSLGILFYELLTGAPPFLGDSLMQVLRKHAHEPPPPLPEHLSRWRPVIDKVLSKLPDDRYQNLGEFIDAVEASRQ